VTCVGTVWPGKGQLDLVAALAQDGDLARRVHLCLLGDLAQDPGYVAAVRRAAADAHLAVELPGCVPAEVVAERLRASHLFVSASRVESYGLSVAEAIACQVPVLAFAAGEIARFGAGVADVHLLPVDAPAARFGEVLRALLREQPRRALPGRSPRFPAWAEVAHAFAIACRR
jgi:glycosyltransferase involved in cell wall biosynthesis